MAKQYGNSGKSNAQVVRNLQSAGRTAAKLAGRTTEKSAVGLAHWATTDHTGIGKSLLNMPSMGFAESSKYILTQFIISIISIVLIGALGLRINRSDRLKWAQST